MPHKIVEHIRAVCKEQDIAYISKQDAKSLGMLVINLKLYGR
jgi:ribosomal protein L7Ae-like RNA K-turn-binding protein